MSFDDAPERPVVVFGVIELAATAGDDAARAPVPGAGRLHRVFAVVAALLLRQLAFPIAEHRAVLGIRERTAGPDQRERLARLRGQLRNRDLGRKRKDD